MPVERFVPADGVSLHAREWRGRDHSALLAYGAGFDLTDRDPVRFEWIDGIHDVPLQRPDAVARRILRSSRGS